MIVISNEKKMCLRDGLFDLIIIVKQNYILSNNYRKLNCPLRYIGRGRRGVGSEKIFHGSQTYIKG